jgi:hypothetical protein
MPPSEVRRFLRHAVPFALIGFALYLAVYGWSELLIRQHAKRNRFFMVKTAPYARYDDVILGASHAAVFDYDDMNARLEAMSGSKILNLATVGGGVTVNRLLLDYFFVHHRAASVLYIVDSFAFYSPQWNEERLHDVRLFYRAPYDQALASLLLRSPAGFVVGLDYLSGFSKINNPGRFDPDISEEEGRFNRTYRPVAQIDDERLAYLYPASAGQPASERDRYLAQFESLIDDVQAHGARFAALKPPIPERVRRMIPDEAGFDRVLRVALARHGIELVDFSSAEDDAKLYSDTDHLNRTGALQFAECCLKQMLAPVHEK